MSDAAVSFLTDIYSSKCFAVLYVDMTVLPSLLPSRRDAAQTKHSLEMLSQCFRHWPTLAMSCFSLCCLTSIITVCEIMCMVVPCADWYRFGKQVWHPSRLLQGACYPSILRRSAREWPMQYVSVTRSISTIYQSLVFCLISMRVLFILLSS